MTTMNTPIKVYVPNLPSRTDRKQSIQKQFEGKRLFDVNIVKPVEHTVASTSLWRTFIGIVEQEQHCESDFFIFCEDDHVFTGDFSEEFLLQCIDRARELKADILSGGFSWYDMPVHVSEHLFWVKRFTGMQFTIVFSKFYSTILESDVKGSKVLDLYLSTLSDDILVMSPYISLQHEFGYSDVTKKNNVQGFVDERFDTHRKRLDILRKVRASFEAMTANDARSII